MRRQSEAEKQMRKAKEMLGISDERAEEIFQEEPDRKQKKRKELEQKKEEEQEEKEQKEAEKRYQEILSGTVDEAKNQISDLNNPDVDTIIEMEKDGKNRKTLLRFLKRMEG